MRKDEKRMRPDNVKLCKICNIICESKMDEKDGSMWINCSTRSCNYWAHLICLGFSLERVKFSLPLQSTQFS